MPYRRLRQRSAVQTAASKPVVHSPTVATRHLNDEGYHRVAHWKERVEMAQWWSDYLDALRNGAEILPFPEQKRG